MFEPVDEHFAEEDDSERLEVHEESREDGKKGEDSWEGGGWRNDGGSTCIGAGVVETEAAGLHNVAEGDDGEHKPELETFYDVGTGELEKIFLFELFEDGGFNLNKLIREE